jgi:hypothetical protein
VGLSCIANRNAVVSQSPGLAQRAYPGNAIRFFINPNEVVPFLRANMATTPLGLFSFYDRYPG